MERALNGVSASPGIVIGRVHLLHWEVPDVPHRIITDDEVTTELERYRSAVVKAKTRLESVRDRAERHAGPEEAAIFEVQLQMLEDGDIDSRVEGYIRQNHGAEKAFDLVMLDWRQHFARSASPMMRERVGDLTDVHIRVLSILLGLGDHVPVAKPIDSMHCRPQG